MKNKLKYLLLIVCVVMIGCTSQLETKKPKPVIIEPPNNVIVEKIM